MAYAEVLAKPKLRKFCKFHNEYGHMTDNCNHLKDEIEMMIVVRYLKEFIYKDRSNLEGKKENDQIVNKQSI